MFRSLALPLIALPLAAAIALPASAQQQQQRHDSNAPIDFDAQHIELQDRANRVTLTGAVRITQAEMILTAARVMLTTTGQLSNGSPEVSRMDASGGVTVVRPNQSANGQFAVYDVDKHLITMIGAVTLKQGTNIVHGGRATLNLDNNRATIDGSNVSGGNSGDSTGVQTRSGRVTGRFSVPKRQGDSNAPATSTTPAPTPK